MRQDVEACNERGGLAMTAVALSADMQRRVLDHRALNRTLASGFSFAFAIPDVLSRDLKKTRLSRG
jgi:hypothetical protein